MVFLHQTKLAKKIIIPAAEEHFSEYVEVGRSDEEPVHLLMWGRNAKCFQSERLVRGAKSAGVKHFSPENIFMKVTMIPEILT